MVFGIMTSLVTHQVFLTLESLATAIEFALKLIWSIHLVLQLVSLYADIAVGWDSVDFSG
jgi:hypothetical protein